MQHKKYDTYLKISISLDEFRRYNQGDIIIFNILNNDKRTITADNFFSSIKLANTFLKNISYIGTLRKNKTLNS